MISKSIHNERILFSILEEIKLTKKDENKLNNFAEENFSNELSFTIDSPPKVKKRPRSSLGGKFMYNPSKKDEDDVRKIIASALPDFVILEKPIILECSFFLKTPVSFSKVNTLLAEDGQILPSGRPDVDNLLKLIQDAIIGIIIKDDNLIVKVVASKFYSVEPRTEVFIRY